MTTDIQAASLPFEEAVQFFRQKANVKTQRWNDVWREGHSRAFMVAGAASDALVQDFREAIDKAIAEGTTFEEFRGDFDRIVAKHGWVHNGTASWRARVIYDTNLAGAYSAGRYAQMTTPTARAAFPFWQYVHGGSVHPRLQHLAWDGLTLSCDDGFWSSHYPPNGWRCSCYVRPVSRAALGRMGKDGPDQAPPIQMRTWVDKVTGARHQVPVGIDPGFDYNPGAAWLRAPVRSDPMKELRAASSPKHGGADVPMPALAPQLAQFLATPAGDVAVGELAPAARRLLGTKVQEVKLSAETIAKQRNHHADLSDADYAVLPELLSDPTIILRQSGTHLQLLRRSGRIWVAVVKRTADAKENYVTSFRVTRMKTLRQLLLRYMVVYGDPGDLQ